jgi:hypothetical protein
VDEPAAIEPEILQPVSAGAWNLRDLQTLVATATDASPEQMDEWRTYLFFLREHAAHDGALPRSFDPLIGDVFAGLLEGRPPA